MTPTPALPKARLEALTDGIFAVAMTLLVLDLHLPEPSHGGTLLDALLRLIDRLDNYVISFAVLAVFWMAHLRIMRRVSEADARFVVINLVFLFLVTLVPPFTTLLGDHPDLPRPAVLYGGNLLLMLGCELMLWHRVCHRLAIDSVGDPQVTWRIVRRRYEVAMGVVLLGVAAAFVEIAIGASTGLAAWVYLLLLGLGTMRPLPH